MPSRGGGRGRGRGGSGGGRPPQTREMTVSKNLGYLLRHGARDEGVEMDEGGWVCVRDLLLWRRLASLKVTLAELNAIVTSNDKQRFQLIPNPKHAPPSDSTIAPSDDPSHFLIRAVQGHSLTTVSADKLLTPISASDPDCPILVVHGTYPNYWREIQKSGGLKPMGRNHIHFAVREPDYSPPSAASSDAKNIKVKELPKDAGANKVLSGMRKGASVLIWVDVKKSMQGGVKWFRSANDVFLTEGLERVGEGGERKKENVLGFEWIRWVERRGGEGEVLWRGEGVDVEGERLANRMGRASVEEGEMGGKGVDGVRTEGENVVGGVGNERYER